MTDQPENPAQSSRKPWLIGGGLLAAGAAIAVVFVLPAEYGIDPTGLGAAMGLTEISDPRQVELERGKLREGVLTLSDAPFSPDPSKTSDQWVRELAPFESIEFKYTLTEGEPLQFSWSATGPLTYDMHAHPFEGGEDLTESYGQDSATAMAGTYVPAFTGIHGWFWRNDSADNVTLTLDASGTLSESTVFEGSTAYKRQIGAGSAQPVAPE
jgi:hypothetical protein